MKKIIVFLVIVCILLLSIVGFFYARDTLLPNKYDNYIQEYSQEFGLNPFLIKGVIRTESDFRATVISNKNAKGLMQITDSTGAWIAQKLGVNNFTPSMLFNPQINIEFGCWYLKDLENQFGNVNNAIAAYNAGRNNVKAWLSNTQYSQNGKILTKIPFTQTANYVQRVNFFEKCYEKLY